MFCLVRCNKIGGSTPAIKNYYHSPYRMHYQILAQHTNIFSLKQEFLFIYPYLGASVAAQLIERVSATLQVQGSIPGGGGAFRYH